MQRLNYTPSVIAYEWAGNLLWDRVLFYYGFYDETNLATTISRARVSRVGFLRARRGAEKKKKILLTLHPRSKCRVASRYRNRIARENKGR